MSVTIAADVDGTVVSTVEAVPSVPVIAEVCAEPAPIAVSEYELPAVEPVTVTVVLLPVSVPAAAFSPEGTKEALLSSVVEAPIGP